MRKFQTVPPRQQTDDSQTSTEELTVLPAPDPSISGPPTRRSMRHAETPIDALISAIATEVVARVRSEMSVPAGVQPILLNVKEAAIYLGRSEQAVQHLIFQKELPVVRLRRRVHLDRRDLDTWIEKNKY